MYPIYLGFIIAVKVNITKGKIKIRRIYWLRRGILLGRDFNTNKYETFYKQKC